MKTGSTLHDFATKIDRLARSVRDFLVSPQHLHLTNHDDHLRLTLNDGAGALSFAPTLIVHDQLAEITNIVPAYYRRMRDECPTLLATNVNTWLPRLTGRRLVRTIEGSNGDAIARAVLSDRYRPLDNERLLAVVLPILAENGVRVESCEVTDRKFYLKAVSDRIMGEVRVGEVVQAGLAISNSEVGCGALSVQPLIYTVRCTNGLVLEDLSLRQHHLGRRHGDGTTDTIQHILSDEARTADDRAFFLRVRDVAKAGLTEAVFQQQLRKLQDAAATPLPAVDVEQVVDVTTKRFGLSEEDGKSILGHLIAGGDLSQWGLCSAVTRYSQDVPDYDRASELERIGGKIIELAPDDWRVLAQVA